MTEWMGRRHGEPLTRQHPVSISLITPTSISGYSNFFRLNSKLEEGWLFLKLGKLKVWERYWVVYDNDTIIYSKEQQSREQTRISMNKVRSLRADNSGCMISISTNEERIQLKMETMDDMNRWLFAFQKSVARVLTNIIEKRSQQYMHIVREAAVGTTASTTEHSEGGGNITRNTSFARMDSTVTTTRAYTDEDVVGELQGGGGGLRISVPEVEVSPRPPSSGRFFEGTPRFVGTPVSTAAGRGANGGGGSSASAAGVGAGGNGMSLAGSLGGGSADTSDTNTVFGLSDSLLTLSQKSYVAPTRMTIASSFASSHSSGNGYVSSMVAMGSAATTGTILGNTAAMGTSPCIPIAAMEEDLLAQSQLEGTEEFPYAEKLSASLSSYKESSGLSIRQCSHESIAREVVYMEGELAGASPLSSPHRRGSQSGRSRASSHSSDAASVDTRRSSDFGTPNDMGGFFGDLDDGIEEDPVGIGCPRSNSNAKKHASPPQPLGLGTPTRRPSNTSATSQPSARVSSLGEQMQRVSTGSNNASASARTSPRVPPPPASLASLACGAHTVTGQRSSNEDRYVCIHDLRTLPTAQSAANAAAATDRALNARESPGGASPADPTTAPAFAAAPSLQTQAGSAPLSGLANLLKDPPATTGATAMVGSSSSANPSTGADTGTVIHCGANGAAAYYGVYDGHSGAHTAAYVNEHLHCRIYEHRKFGHDLTAAISESCIAMDVDVLEQCRLKKWHSGTTAIGAFVIGSKLTVFNIGDCQAVLCSDGQSVIMNRAHSPGRADEKERIVRAGAWVTEEQNYDLDRVRHMDLDIPFIKEKAKRVEWVTVHRVCGEIAVSRSIGDPDYKGFTPGVEVPLAFCWPEGHNQTLTADPVIPDPEFIQRDLIKDDEFLVIACDGLWDVVSVDEAVAIVRHALSKHKDPQLIAKELCSLALKLGSEDNVTIIIVVFAYNS